MKVLGRACSMLILVCCLFLVVSSQEVVVSTRQGPIKGFIETSTQNQNSPVVQFHGIPYAKPPVGDLRWKKPVATDPWSDVLVAKTEDPMGTPCMQRTTGTREHYNISEDCLSLNVYTPALSGKKAVMFFIHGGGFNRGTAREYDGKHLASIADVVVVTVNYRLNIMGFFDSDGDGVWENYGLWDIKLSLQWVQDNIESFGGDKNKVTIFGGSSGGMTVTLLASSAEFSGLFHRVIGESGTHLCPKLLERDPSKVHMDVRKAADCHSAQCLKQASAEKIFNIANTIRNGNLTFPVMYTFGAYQDGIIMKGNPFVAWKFYRTGNQINDTIRQEMISTFKTYDYMGGYNTAEGSLIVTYLKRLAKQQGFTIEDGANEAMVNLFLSEYLGSYFPHSSDEKISLFKRIYFNSVNLQSTPDPQVAQIILNIYTDLLFAAPTLQLLDGHSERNNQTSTHMYTFTHETADGKASYPSWFRGSQHTDERIFVFGEYPTIYGIEEFNMTAEETQIMKEMMTTWGNFAKSGNPNGENLSFTWRQYSRSYQYFKEFGASQVDVSSRFYNMRRIQAIQDPDSPTTPDRKPNAGSVIG